MGEGKPQGWIGMGGWESGEILFSPHNTATQRRQSTSVRSEFPLSDKALFDTDGEKPIEECVLHQEKSKSSVDADTWLRPTSICGEGWKRVDAYIEN